MWWACREYSTLVRISSRHLVSPELAYADGANAECATSGDASTLQVQQVTVMLHQQALEPFHAVSGHNFRF